MKTIKRIALTLLFITFIVLLFRGFLFRHLISYKSLGQRAKYSVTEASLVECIDESFVKGSDIEIKQIIILGLSITSDQLSFSASESDTDPNKLIITKKAHCVGYACFFAATCNHLLDQFHLDDTWVAKPQIGQLHFLGTNIHEYSNSPFFKDHDFVTVENKKTGEFIGVDPTVHDFLRIDFVTYFK